MIWTGDISGNWDDPGNWNVCGLPDSTRIVIIPDVSPKSYPVLNGVGYCKTIRVEYGAYITIGPTGTLIVTKKE